MRKFRRTDDRIVLVLDGDGVPSPEGAQGIGHVIQQGGSPSIPQRFTRRRAGVSDHIPAKSPVGCTGNG